MRRAALRLVATCLFGFTAFAAAPAVAQLTAVKYAVPPTIWDPVSGQFVADMGDIVRWRVEVVSMAPVPITGASVTDLIGGDSGCTGSVDCLSAAGLQLLCGAPNEPDPGPDGAAVESCDEMANQYSVSNITVPAFGSYCVEYSTMVTGAGMVGNQACVSAMGSDIPTSPPAGGGANPSMPATCATPPVSPAPTPACTQVVIAALPDFEFDNQKRGDFLTSGDLNGNGILDVGDEITWTVTLTDTSTDGEDITGFGFDDIPAGTSFGAITLEEFNGMDASGTCAFDMGRNLIDCPSVTFSDGDEFVLEFTTTVECDSLTDDDSMDICNSFDICSDMGRLSCVGSDSDSMAPPEPTCLALPVPDFTGSQKTWDWTDNDDDGSVSAGDTAIFTIEVTNDGRADANNVVVTDLLDDTCMDLATVDPMSGTFDMPSGTITWNVASIASGASDTVGFTVDLLDAAVCCNQAEVTSDEREVCAPIAGIPTDDPTTPAADDPTCIPFGPQPNLEVTKDFVLTDDPDMDGVTVGDTIRFDVVIRNVGGGDATGVSMTDLVPACFGDCDPMAVTITGEGTNNSTGPGMGTACTIQVDDIGGADGLTPMEAVTISWEVSVQNTMCCNQATVSFAESGSDVTSTDPATGEMLTCADRAGAALSITKDAVDADMDGCFEPGEEVTFTLEVTSSGGSTATGVTAQDDFMAGLTLVDAGTGVFDGTSTITWDVGDLAPGEMATLTWTAMVDCDLVDDDPLTNLASAVATNAPMVETSWSGTADAPVLVVTKDAMDGDGDGVAAVGEDVTFTITIENTGGCDAENVVVTDPIDPDLDDTMLTISDGGTFADPNVTWDETTTPGLASIAAGTMVTLTVTAPALDPITNPDMASDGMADDTVTVTANEPDSALCDRGMFPELMETASSPTVPIGIVPTELTVTKTAEDADMDGCYEPGEEITYTITVTNETVGTLTNVTLVDDLMMSGVLTVTDPGTGTYDMPSDTITWMLGDMAGGATEMRTWVGTVDPAAADATAFSDTATATADTGETADATWDGAVSSASLTLTKEATMVPDPVVDGAAIEYTITVENTSATCSANDVVVTDTLDPDIKWDPATITASDGGVNDMGTPPTITWDGTSTPALAEIPAGGTVVLTLSVQVHDDDAMPQGGEDDSIENLATASGAGGVEDASGSSTPLEIGVTGPMIYRNAFVSCLADATETFRTIFIDGMDPAIDPAAPGSSVMPASGGMMVFTGDADPSTSNPACPQVDAATSEDNRILVAYELDTTDTVMVTKDAGDVVVTWMP